MLMWHIHILPAMIYKKISDNNYVLTKRQFKTIWNYYILWFWLAFFRASESVRPHTCILKDNVVSVCDNTVRLDISFYLKSSNFDISTKWRNTKNEHEFMHWYLSTECSISVIQLFMPDVWVLMVGFANTTYVSSHWKFGTNGVLHLFDCCL